MQEHAVRGGGKISWEFVPGHPDCGWVTQRVYALDISHRRRARRELHPMPRPVGDSTLARGHSKKIGDDLDCPRSE